MHFGGVHFIYGILLLFVTSLLTAVYVYFGYTIFVTFQKLVNKYRKTVALNRFLSGHGPSPDESISKPKFQYWNKSFFIWSLVLSSILLGVVYIGQRVHWMGEGSAHHEAKEYWVTGQVVFAPRKYAEQFLHPDNPITWPYKKVQELIFKTGIKLLPETDGEIGVWQNQWFLFLYSRKSRRPYGVGNIKMEPKMIQLIDEYWQTIEQMATRPYADKNMEKQYLLSFPVLATYYNTHDGHYTGKLYDSGTVSRKDPIIMNRLGLLLTWLDAIEKSWGNTGLRKTIDTKYPGVAAIKFVTQMRIVHEILFSKALNNEFKCDDPLVARFHEMYKTAMSDDDSINNLLLYKKKNSKQAKVLYASAVYSVKGCSGRFLLTKGCGLELPKENNAVVNKTYPVFQYTDKQILSQYREELKNILVWRKK